MPLVSAFNRLLKNKLELLDFFTLHLLKLFTPQNLTQEYWKSKTFDLIDMIRLDEGRISLCEYSELVLIFITTFLSSNYCGKKVAFNRFLAGCAGCTENGWLLLNQAPTAMQVNDLNCHPDSSVFIAVARDPRDQYLDQIRDRYSIAMGIYSDVNEFINFTRENRDNFEREVEYLSSFKILKIQFEEFILKEDVRRSLLKEIGLSAESRMKYFQPSESLKNIRLYELDLNRTLHEQIKIISRHLPCSVNASSVD